MALIAARLAREGWTPPEPVDSDRENADALVKKWLAGNMDTYSDFALASIKRGRELERAEAKPEMVWVKHDGSVESPAPMEMYVFVKGKRNGQVWTEKEIWAEKAKYVFWEFVTHYAIITQPTENAA